MMSHFIGESLACFSFMSVFTSYFAGGALAAPAHWFYVGKQKVIADYGHEITDYTKPNRELAGCILNKSDLNGGGRSSNFGGSNGNQTSSIIGQVINRSKQDLWSHQSQQVDSLPYHLATGRPKIPSLR
jgi:hypothetical protein